MISDNHRIAKNTGLLYIRQLFTLFVSFYTSRLTLQVLGETDFGVYATVGGITAFLSTITNALASGTQRFITISLGKGDEEELNKVYVTSVNLHLLLSVLLILLGETLGSWFILNKMHVPPDRLMTSYWVFQITLLNSCFALINIPNNAEIIAHEDMGPWAFVQILDSLLRLLFIALLFVIKWDKLLAYAIALFIIQFINRSICHLWCKFKYKEVKYHFIFDKKLIKSMLGIAGWTSLSNAAISGFVQGTNVLINVFFGPVVNAANSVAMQAYSGLRSFCSSFQLASNPQIVKLYSTGNIVGMRELLFSVCKISFFLVFLISLPFLLNAEFVLQVWLKDVPEHASTFFILLLLYSYSDVLAYPLDIVAQATGRLRKYSSLISLIVISILPLSYVFYLFGYIPETIYYIAIVVSWIGIATRLLLLEKLINIDLKSFLKEVVGRIVLVAGCSVSIPLFLSKVVLDRSLPSVLFVMLLSVLSCVFFIFLLGLSKNEKDMVSSLFHKLMKKV